MKPIPVQVDQPIACTLAADQVDGRVADWADLLTHVVRRQATDDGAMRLTFDGDVDRHALIDLTVAEQGCCSFFSFSITLDGRGVALEVRAPDDAAELVTLVFGAEAELR